MRIKASRVGCRLIPWNGLFLAAASLLLLFCSQSAFAQNAISTGPRAGFRMFYPNSNDWWLDPSAGRLDFRVNGLPAKATLDALGNLGIGTASPAAVLDVKGSVNADGVNMFLRNSAGNTSNYTAYYDITGNQWNVGNFATSRFAIFQNGTVPGASGIVFSGPNVGIGTVSPSQKLHLAGGIFRMSNNQSINMENAAGTETRALMATTGDLLQLGDTVRWGGIIFQPGSAEAMRIASSGRVGIGTTTPGEALEVNGKIIAQDPISASHVATRGWVLAQAGGGTPSGWTCTVVQNSIGNPSAYTLTASCSGGAKAISGGCNYTTGPWGSPSFTGQGPATSGEGWTCYVNGCGQYCGTAYAYVKCCQ